MNAIIEDVREILVSRGLCETTETEVGTFTLHWTRVGSSDNYVEVIFPKRGNRDVVVRLLSKGWIKQPHFRSRTGLADHYQRFHNPDRRKGVLMSVFWHPISEEDATILRSISTTC